MKWLRSRILWGGLLILGGLLFLLQNLEVIQFGDLFWALVFGLGGLFFLSFYISDRLNWWALIPGIILLDLAAIIALGVLAPGISQVWSGSVFLAGLSLAFWLVYLTERHFWWAVIPGGVLLTLAVVAGIGQNQNSELTVSAFFLGLGLTFAVVGILPVSRETGEPYLRWAFIPAAVLMLIGVLFAAASGQYLNLIWPVALILVGVFLLARSLLFRRA